VASEGLSTPLTVDDERGTMSRDAVNVGDHEGEIMTSEVMSVVVSPADPDLPRPDVPLMAESDAEDELPLSSFLSARTVVRC
jgi:hypothetical protein